MSASNRKVLTRNSSICLDDRAFEQIQCQGGSGYGGDTLEDFNHKEVTNNFPDVISNIPKSQDSYDSYKDPDIVRSNSSSDEKSLDTHVSPDRARFRSKFSKPVQSSVSSFSSTGSSNKQSSSSSIDQNRKSKTSTVGYFSSVDNDEHLLNSPKESANENCLFNQDSVFAQECEDVFDQSQQLIQLQPMNLERNIEFPIMESNLLLDNKEGVSSGVVPSCSEQGQKARNRFSSSGYGTGSGDSAQKTSASKTSVRLSKESFTGEDVAPLQDTQTYTLNSEKSKCVENNLASRNIKFYSATVGSEVSPDVDTLSQQGCVKAPHGNQNSCHIIPTDVSVISNGTKTKHYLAVSTEELKCGLALSLGHKNSGCLQQHGSHGPNALANTNSPQVKKESLVTAQNVKEHMININSTAAVCAQAPPQAGTSGMSLTCLQQQSSSIHGRSSTGYTDSPDHMATPFFQHFLNIGENLNYNPSQLSSSSSASYIVPASVEERWTAEPSHISLMKLLLLQSGPGASESSGETRYHLDSVIKMVSQEGRTPRVADTEPQEVHSGTFPNIPDFDELLSNMMTLSDDLSSALTFSCEGQFEKDIWTSFQRSVRCEEDVCDYDSCLQIKKVMAVLQDTRKPVWSLCEIHKALLLKMFHHTVYSCDHPKCPFAWCGERIDDSDHLSQEERLLTMKQRVENFAEHCMLQSSPTVYMKLNPKLSYDSMPAEGQDWIRLCMMGDSRRSVLVKLAQSENCDACSDSKYWVIKKVSTADDGDHWGLYSRLRELNHKSVVTLLWAANFEDHILVCSVYEDFSLRECLTSLPPSQLRFVSIFSVMQQLMSATRHLNSLGIAYLYWISKNILVTYCTAVDCVVKLSNFSCSVLLEPPGGKQPCYDGGHLLLALPRHIITPELRDKAVVEFASDVWGLGCLLHELVTGHPVWHEHRHVLDKDFKSMIGKKPHVPTVCSELVDVLTACWEIESSKRVQLTDLEIMLINAFQVHLMTQ